MMKFLRFGLIAAFAGVLVTGCSGDDEPFGLMENQTAVEAPAPMSTPTFHTVAAPMSNDLLAGQDIDVGDVLVWNDLEKLYVKYVISGPWCITETHLHVASTLGAIPQTKKKNPIPGQFDEKGYHDCVDMVEYDFDVTQYMVGDELTIAAHAVVWDMTSEESMMVYSDDDQGIEVAVSNLPGAPFPAVDVWEAFCWRLSGAALTACNDDSAPSFWDGKLTGHSFTMGDWIWEDEEVNDATAEESAEFEHGFEVPGWPTGGTLYITADNYYNVWLNGGFIGERVQSAYQSWPTVDSYGLLPNLGANSLYVTATNYAGPGGTWWQEADPYDTNNPAGLIYEAALTFYAVSETAWGTDGECEFAGKNWATCIVYEVQCPAPPTVVNGGFEAPEVTRDPNWDVFPTGTTGLGWTVAWTDAAVDAPGDGLLELQKGDIGGRPPYELNQKAELDTDWDFDRNGEPANVAISQDVAVCGGQDYNLKYYYAQRTAADAMDVGFGDASASIAEAAVTDWLPGSLFYAATVWGDVSISFTETGPANSLGMYLDNVFIEFDAP